MKPSLSFYPQFGPKVQGEYEAEHVQERWAYQSPVTGIPTLHPTPYACGFLLFPMCSPLSNLLITHLIRGHWLSLRTVLRQ